MVVPGAFIQKKKKETKGDSAGLRTKETLFKKMGFFRLDKMQELTPSPNQDKIWHEGAYLGYLHTSPTLGVCIAEQHNSSVWSSSFPS
jgi:hypothetical protein